MHTTATQSAAGGKTDTFLRVIRPKPWIRDVFMVAADQVAVTLTGNDKNLPSPSGHCEARSCHREHETIYL